MTENRKPDVAGDHLNAQRFLAEYRGRVRRSPQLGTWFLWNDAWWADDQLELVMGMAAATIDKLRQWVTEAEGIDDFRRRSKHYEASARAGRRDALLSLVGTDPNVVVAVDQLDSHPYLLACANGTVNLRTGELRSADPADLLTRGVSVAYDADASSALWDRFIEDTFGGDKELMSYVQRVLGYCITGVVKEHILPVLHGVGANGKSTLVGVTQDLLGDHAMTAPEGLVIAHKHEPHPERIASLRGRRLVVSNELEQRAVLAEQTVKMLTGGDTLTARELYGHRFNFKPSHKILLVTNHRPRISGRDHAMWRRVAVVPFNVVIPDDQQDPLLRQRLVGEHGPAILAWLVQGAMAWHREGVGEAAAVTEATEQYRQSQDTFATFLSEHTVELPRVRTKVGDLWDLWRSWSEQSGERPGRKQDFAATLEENGYELETYQNAKYVRHLGIREAGEVS